MRLTQLTLTTRVGLSAAIIATGIALVGGAGCGGGASAATVCKSKIACEGTGDQKQCEDTLAKQEKDWPTDCKSKVSSYVTCMSSGTSCTMKIFTSGAGDTNCAKVVMDYTTCAAQNPVSVTGGDGGTGDAAYCKALAECDKTTTQAKCEADQAEVRDKLPSDSNCRTAYDAFNACIVPLYACVNGNFKVPDGSCASASTNFTNACFPTPDAGNP